MSNKRIHKTLEEVEAEHILPGDAGAGSGESWSVLDESETFDDLTSMADELLSVDEPEVSAAPERRRARRRSVDRRPKPAKAPAGMVFAGLALTTGGFALSVVSMLKPDTLGNIGVNLSRAGLTPGLMVMIGVAILAITSILRSQQTYIQSQLDWVAANDESTSENLEFLVEAEQRNTERRPASGEELEQVLHSLARQDEKIANITKALKMYGKPLVDVNRQALENGQRGKQMVTLLSEINQQVHSNGQLDSIQEQLIDLAKLDTIQAQLGELAQLGPMRQQIAGLDERLTQPIANMLKDSGKETIDELMRAVEILAEQVSSDITKALASVPKEDNSARVIDATRQELTQLQNQLSQQFTDQLNRAVSNISRSAPAVSAPAPRATAPAPAAAASAATAQVASAAGATAPPPGEGPATSISGTATTSAKSVMGAIAKLKKMR